MKKAMLSFVLALSIFGCSSPSFATTNIQNHYGVVSVAYEPGPTPYVADPIPPL